jgi:Flp pilus assembly protein CpaB
VKRSNRLLILVGVLLAVTGAIGAMVIANGGSKPTGPSAASPSVTPEPKVQVVVANKDIAAGVQITSDMLATQDQPISVVTLAGDTFTDVPAVTGRITAVSVKKGQIIVGSRDLLTPGSMADGQSISGSIASGMVGVSMEVDQINGVGTLIVPGDRVDIVLSVYVPALGYQNIKDAAGNEISIDGRLDVTTKMVIQNVRVLGTLLPPEQLVPEVSGAPVVAPTAPIVQNTGRHMVAIVEVTPEQAEVLRWAQREEITDTQNYIDLSLALRSNQDGDLPPVTTGGITFKQLVDKYGVLPIDQRAILPADIAATIQW